MPINSVLSLIISSAPNLIRQAQTIVFLHEWS
jgi:hypothetical protein